MTKSFTFWFKGQFGKLPNPRKLVQLETQMRDLYRRRTKLSEAIKTETALQDAYTNCLYAWSAKNETRPKNSARA